MYKLSVIVPVYNVKEYIVETMESIFKQTLQEFELILIDDGSTDGSYEILKEYEKKHSNIKLLRQENSGPSKARNNGLRIATGEYVVFVDSDDLMPNDSFEFRYNLAKEKDAEVVICGTERTEDGIERTPLRHHQFKEEYKKLDKNTDILWALGPCNKIFKKETIEGIYFPENINYAEDQVFTIAAYLNAKKIYASKYVVYYYRIRKNSEDSLTHQVQTNSANVLKQVCEAWKISVNLIEEKIKDKDIAYNIKGNYFYRLMIIDIWPPLEKALKSKDKTVQLEGLKNVSEILDNIGDSEWSRVGKLKRIALKDVIGNNKLTDKEKIFKLKRIMFVYRTIITLKSIVGK